MRAYPLTRGPDVPDIPDKLYFRIGEVAQVTGVKPHVLRYWETEFAGISPKKAPGGHRLYRRGDVELILEIKRLLYEQRFTIEGARKHLGQRPKKSALKQAPKPAQGDLFAGQALDQVRRELEEILRLLS